MLQSDGSAERTHYCLTFAQNVLFGGHVIKLQTNTTTFQTYTCGIENRQVPFSLMSSPLLATVQHKNNSLRTSSSVTLVLYSVCKSCRLSSPTSNLSSKLGFSFLELEQVCWTNKTTQNNQYNRNTVQHVCGPLSQVFICPDEVCPTTVFVPIWLHSVSCCSEVHHSEPLISRRHGWPMSCCLLPPAPSDGLHGVTDDPLV